MFRAAINFLMLDKPTISTHWKYSHQIPNTFCFRYDPTNR